MLRSQLLLIAVLLTVAGVGYAADGDTDSSSLAELDATTQSLKSDILDLQAELLALERDIRYPPTDRWTVFVTRPSDTAVLKLKRITLEVDGTRVAEHRYSQAERQALRDDGAHRLYFGTLARGRHQATVVLVGQHDGNPYRRKQTFTIDKPDGPRLMALKVHPKVARAEGKPEAPGIVARHLDDLP